MAFDPLPVGTRLSSGATIGQKLGPNTYAITPPVLKSPLSAGAYPVATPVSNGNGGPLIVSGGGGCGGGAAVYPQSSAAMARGSMKRPDFGPVVAFTSQTMPKGFVVGARAFGLVIPEGR
jgi:hypothetical protein